jgi:hypothetical protein
MSNSDSDNDDEFFSFPALKEDLTLRAMKEPQDRRCFHSF